MLDTITQDVLKEILIYLDYDILKIQQLSYYFRNYFKANKNYIISRLFKNHNKNIVLNHAHTIYIFYMRNSYHIDEINEDMLVCATATNNLKIVKFFLENDKTLGLDMALKYAANNNMFGLFKFLVENGAIISDETLREIYEWSNIRIIKYILKINSDYGISLSQRAIFHDCRDIAKYLIKNNYIDADYALSLACDYSRLEIAQYAVEYGAVIDLGVLETASYGFHNHITEYLLIYYTNLCHEIYILYSGGYLALIKCLKDGSVLYSIDLLYLIVFNNQLPVLKHLIRNNTKDIVKDMCELAISLAARYKCLEILTYLYELRGGYSHDDLLYIAVYNYDLETVKYLVKQKYNITDSLRQFVTTDLNRQYSTTIRYLIDNDIVC